MLVLCESLGLRSLPHSVPLSTSALSVARNRLCNIDHLLQPFSGLQELSLRHNQLARFPRGLPPSLETLQLQENRITYITSGTLRQLGNLTRLDLEDNRIRVIQPGALLGLRRLQVLTLKGNRLTNMPLNLPPSLTHLDVSANCISALDLPSLTALVNLQVLKINSNCLRSVPERAFDSLTRLSSVELANNLWVCECDILYLYRWLLSGHLKMATDLVCTEPVHLAHRLLLNISVMTICPRALKPNERVPRLGFTSTPERRLAISTSTPVRKLDISTVETTAPRFYHPFGNTRDLGSLTDISSQRKSKRAFTSIEPPSLAHVNVHQDSAPMTRIMSEHYSLETFSYEECLSLNETQSLSPPQVTTTMSIPKEEPRCLDNTTGRYPLSNSTSIEGTGPLLSTNKAGSLPTPAPGLFYQQSSSVVIALLTVLCVLVVFLMLAVLLVLKMILLRQQRVAPLQQS